MGLDMYVIAKKKGSEEKEVGYFRKHNWLHGAMEELWESKGRPLPSEWDEERKASHMGDESFNCVPVRLLIKDINKIMTKIRRNKLEPVEGFFFGGGEPDEYTKKEELEVLNSAKEYIREGYKVYYDSWW
jgi:hypothetical protein